MSSDFPITNHAELERYLQNHDALTLLVNRRSLSETFTLWQVAHVGEGQLGVLIFVSLDGFRDVNDQYGMIAGDQVLVEIARRLVGLISRSGVASHPGGDQFVSLVDGTQSEHEVKALAERIGAIFDEPISISLSNEVELVPQRGSVVAIFWRTPDAELGDLMRRAKSALMMAQRERRGSYVLVSESDS